MPRIKKQCPYRRCTGEISLSSLPHHDTTIVCGSCGQRVLVTPKGDVSKSPRGEEEAD
jgi:DNA-directed RNA polymerase subunit RPC12/RpoP